MSIQSRKGVQKSNPDFAEAILGHPTQNMTRLRAVQCVEHRDAWRSSRDRVFSIYA